MIVHARFGALTPGTLEKFCETCREKILDGGWVIFEGLRWKFNIAPESGPSQKGK